MKQYIRIIILLIIIIALYCTYDKFAYLNIVVKFDELEPYDKPMSLYLKGFKVGKTKAIYPDKDFVNTYIKVKLSRKYVNLPKNISAKVIRNKGVKYINLIYPNSPEIERLKNYAIIQGKTTKDINSIMNEQFVDEGLEDVINDATGLLENANNAVNSLDGIFKDIRIIVDDLKPNLNRAAENLTDTTNSLKNMSNKIDTAFNLQIMENSAKNIEEITKNINEITNQIEVVSMPEINGILCETKEAMGNIQELTDDINNSVKKRKGISKLLFGRR